MIISVCVYGDEPTNSTFINKFWTILYQYLAPLLVHDLMIKTNNLLYKRYSETCL